MIKFKTTVEGCFKIEAVKSDGTERILADWFPNLILNSGLDRIGAASDWINYCQVGTGNSTPSITQTALDNTFASSNSYYSDLSGNSGASPWYTYTRRVYQFTAGTTSGEDLKEIGIGWGATGDTLFNRALILDVLGNPTAVTVLDDETLKVTYLFKRYINEEDTTGSITVTETYNYTADTYTTYNWTGRAAYMGDINYWPAIFYAKSAYSTLQVLTYNGSLSSYMYIPSSPSGTATTTEIISAYVPGSYTTTWRYDWSTAQGNAVGGISAMLVKIGGGLYQVGFIPSIPKDTGDIMSITFQCTWGRHT